MTAKYLYGVIRNPGALEFGPIGLADGNEEVYVVGQDSIAGIVSSYHGPQLRDLPRHELLRQLAIHQKVIERVMLEHTILPARFGTVLADEGEVRRAIDHGHRWLEEAVEKFDALVEYEVAATWELGPVFDAIAGEKEVAELRAAVAAMPAAESLPVRARIGAMIKESLDRRREDLRSQLTLLLAEHAVDHQANALMGDEMVLNVAFLVPRSAREVFVDCLHQADAGFDGKLGIRCIGPLPPYTFATVDIARPDPKEMDAALQLLGLGRRISASAVRRAYRERAATLHPDVNRSPDAASLFSRLRGAEALLTTYCLGKPDGREDGSCLAPQEEMDRAYLISVKRAGL